MIVLKILAVWTVLSIVFGLIVAPIIGRRIHTVDRDATESPASWFARHKFKRWA